MAGVAMVTGAGRGLGAAIADKLLVDGWSLSIGLREQAQAKRFDVGSDRLHVGHFDALDPASAEQWVNDTVNHFGEINALVNNAGIYPIFKLETASDEQLRSVINTNVLGAMYACREAIPLLKKSKGDIINVSSEAVRFYPPLLSVYTASKSALEAFSQSLRVELAPSGVRVAALRVGHLLREDPSPLDDETYELMIKTFEETGFMASTGEGMQLDTVTSAAIHLLTLPADATIDLLEIRSRH